MPARLLFLALALLLVLPLSASAADGSLDVLGCYKDLRDGRYRCEEGIAAGMSFVNQEAMVRYIQENRLFPGAKKEKTRSVSLMAGKASRIYTPVKLLVRTEGKTITVILYGVDAPPEGSPAEEAAVTASKAALAGTKVFLEKVTGDEERRMSAVVGLSTNETLQALLLESGLVSVSASCKHPLCEEWKTLEQDARFAGKGMWGEVAEQTQGAPLQNAPTPPTNGVAPKE